MSITKCLNRKSSRALIKYLLDAKPHDTGLVQHRNLLVTGQNLETFPGRFNGRFIQHSYQSPFVAEQFNAAQGLSKASKKGKKKDIQAFHLIVSFSDSEFPPDGDQKKEAEQAAKLTKGFLSKQLPPDSQYLMAVQRDGKGHKLHVHVALNSVQINGKVIRRQYLHQRDWDYVTKDGKHIHEPGLASNLDKYLEDNFQRVTGREFHPVVPSTENKVHSAEDQIVARGGYDWHEDLKERIYQAFSDPKVHDLSGFKAACAKRGVTVTEKRRGTGKKDANGKKIYKLGYTYSFTGQDKYKSGAKKGMPKAHKMRDYRMGKDGMPLRGSLGTAFTPESIEKEIKNHEFIKKERVQADKQARTAECTREGLEAVTRELRANLKDAVSSGDADREEAGSFPSPRPIKTVATTAKYTSSGASRSDQYIPSRRRRHFATPPRLKWVDPGFLDPDPDAERRRKRLAEERKRRDEQFERRAKAIAEHDRQLARKAGADRIRQQISPSWFDDLMGKWWHIILSDSLTRDLKRLLGLGAHERPVGHAKPESRAAAPSNRPASREDTLNNPFDF